MALGCPNRLQAKFCVRNKTGAKVYHLLRWAPAVGPPRLCRRCRLASTWECGRCRACRAGLRETPRSTWPGSSAARSCQRRTGLHRPQWSRSARPALAGERRSRDAVQGGRQGIALTRGGTATRGAVGIEKLGDATRTSQRRQDVQARCWHTVPAPRILLKHWPCTSSFEGRAASAWLRSSSARPTAGGSTMPWVDRARQTVASCAIDRRPAASSTRMRSSCCSLSREGGHAAAGQSRLASASARTYNAQGCDATTLFNEPWTTPRRSRGALHLGWSQ